MRKCIFWDVDETLVYTSVFSRNEKTENYKKHSVKDLPYREFYLSDKDPFLYFSILRPSALELLEYSRLLVGQNNVYTLSTGTEKYIKTLNREFRFGFRDENIFTRENIDSMRGSELFKETFNVLIDNLTYYDHRTGGRNKIKFLNNLSYKNYICIPEFTIYGFSEKDENELFDNISKKITEIIKDESS